MTILQSMRKAFHGTEELKEEEVVLVYGSLREGLGNHAVIEGCDRIGDTFTVEGLDMFPIGDQFGDQLTIGGISYPYCVNGDGSVVVECYLADDERMKALDKLEGYPQFYNRKKVRAKDEDGNVIVGWIYYLEGAGGRHLIPNGDWSAFLEAVAVSQAERSYKEEVTGENSEEG